MSDIVFLSGKRTPFGTLLGAMSKLSAVGEAADVPDLRQLPATAS